MLCCASQASEAELISFYTFFDVLVRAAVCVCLAFVLWGWLWSGLAVKYSHCFGMGMRVCIWMIVARFGVSVS